MIDNLNSPVKQVKIWVEAKRGTILQIEERTDIRKQLRSVAISII